MFAIFLSILYNLKWNQTMELKNNNRDLRYQNLHQGHRNRLQERLIETKFNCPEHELLEFILQQPIKRKDTNELAHKLLYHFGSFANICDASADELMKIDGVGKATATFLTSLPKVFQTYKQSKISNSPILETPKDVYNFLGQSIEHLPKEEFYVICLNSVSKVINYKRISSGDGNVVSFDIQYVSNYCQSVGANKVVLVHNHPTGSSLPSSEDINATKMLYFNLYYSGIELTEHVIVDHLGNIFSFSREGLLKEFAEEKKI